MEKIWTLGNADILFFLFMHPSLVQSFVASRSIGQNRVASMSSMAFCSMFIISQMWSFWWATLMCMVTCCPSTTMIIIIKPSPLPALSSGCFCRGKVSKDAVMSFLFCFQSLKWLFLSSLSAKPAHSFIPLSFSWTLNTFADVLYKKNSLRSWCIMSEWCFVSVGLGKKVRRRSCFSYFSLSLGLTNWLIVTSFCRTKDNMGQMSSWVWVVALCCQTPDKLIHFVRRLAGSLYSFTSNHVSVISPNSLLVTYYKI